MSYPPVLILIIESGGGGGGGEGGGEEGVRIFCPMVRLSPRTGTPFGMRNENKGLRITYFINFLASSLIMQISYKAL